MSIQTHYYPPLIDLAFHRIDHPKKLKKLLDKHPKVLNRLQNGKSLLHQAIQLENIDAIKLLLSYPKIDVNSISSAGNTPMDYAIELKNKEIIQLLLATKKVSFSHLNAKNYTPITFACTTHQKEVAEMIASEAHCEGIYKSFHMIKLMGHIFGNLANLYGKYYSFKKQKIFFEGGKVESLIPFMITSMQAFTKSISTDQKILSRVALALQKMLDNKHHKAKISNTELSQITQGHLTVFDTGWNQHRVYVVFAHGYMAICNTGANPLKKPVIDLYKINSEKITPIIIRLLKNNPNLSKEQGSDILYNKIPQFLEAQHVNIDLPSHKPQKGGTCTWASAKSAVAACLFIDRIKRSRKMIDFNDVYGLYKKWSTFTRQLIVDKCEKEMKHIDPHLIELAKTNIANRRTHFPRNRRLIHRSTVTQ